MDIVKSYTAKRLHDHHSGVSSDQCQCPTLAPAPAIWTTLASCQTVWLDRPNGSQKPPPHSSLIAILLECLNSGYRLFTRKLDLFLFCFHLHYAPKRPQPWMLCCLLCNLIFDNGFNAKEILCARLKDNTHRVDHRLIPLSAVSQTKTGGEHQ